MAEGQSLEERVTQLEWLVGIIARQVADPPNQSRPANDPGGIRIVRQATRTDVHSGIERLLDDLGFGDIGFEVR